MNYSEQQLSAAVTSQGLRPVLAGPESGVPPGLASLIQQCWEGDASLRPSFDKIVETLDAIFIPQPHVKTVPVDPQNNALDAILSYNLQQKHTEVNWAARAAKDWEPTSTQLLSVSPSWLTPSMDNSVYYPTLSIGSFATKGARQTMEDTHFVISQLGGADHVSVFGVFDGHRGPEAAEFAALTIPSFLSKSAALRYTH
jgi:hypothetical protein